MLDWKCLKKLHKLKIVLEQIVLQIWDLDALILKRKELNLYKQEELYTAVLLTFYVLDYLQSWRGKEGINVKFCKIFD